MRLRTKLALAAASSTFAIVLVLSLLFLGEMLRQRVAQTASNNEVMGASTADDDAPGSGGRTAPEPAGR